MTPRRLTTGFTIVELLIVIALISLLVALAVPTLSKITEGIDESAAVNTVAVTLNVTRTMAEKQRRNFGFSQWSSLGAPIAYNNDPGVYSGTAAIFTPAGEIRMTENDERAMTHTGVPLELYPDAPNNPEHKDQHNGFVDTPAFPRGVVPFDYVTLPSKAGVAGLFRDQNGVHFLAPPFAIRFNEDGQLIASDDTNNQAVFYDGNYDKEYQVNGRGSSRDNPYGDGSRYDPRLWDPRSGDYQGTTIPSADSDTPGLHDATNKFKLPFERLESVIGVVVYDKDRHLNEVYDEGFDWNSAQNKRWLLDNGTMLYVSRYTGTIIRESEDQP